jgi:hypothetical protein
MDTRKKAVQAEKDNQTAVIREQMMAAKETLEAELQGFATQMASKILGRSL